MTEPIFRPVEVTDPRDEVYAATDDFRCVCGRSVELSTLDLEPFICVCGRRYRLVARVEVAEVA